VIPTEHILADLTETQRQAVTHTEGPLLVVAGAGSGKTRVITRRVAYLLSLGVQPNSILAITFTNKAAGEMKTRIAGLMDRPLRDFGRLEQPWPMICTFHSLGLRILKHYAPLADLPPNFTVYDESDQQLIKDAMKAAELSAVNYPASRVQYAISEAKNRLLTPEAYAQAVHKFPETYYARAYKHYQKALDHNKAVDFDDLLMRPAHLFRDHPDVLRQLQQRFMYILIDEYQDTNHAQYVVAHALALAHRNICVVGDPDQSIYAWRGADIRNILEFEKDYPDAKIVKLEQNYRSTKVILEIASGLIAHNRKRKKKRLFTENPAGERARLLLTENEHAEAQAITQQFKQLKEEGFPWNQMAVLYRINAMSRVMEDALRRAGIPYRIARGVDFYHRKEIKDVLAYLRVMANPFEELSLARIVNVPPRGIGAGSIGHMQARALDQGWTLWHTLENIDQVASVSPKAVKAVKQLVSSIESWRALADARGDARISVRDLIDRVVEESGIETYYKKVGGEEKAELYNINELISSAAQFDDENPQGTLEDYLNQVSLISDIDMLEESGAVTLMTLHAAKGLEFPVVAIIALEEGSLPHARVQDHPDQLEEERRLCFVGITRARQRLILSRAARRTIRGVSGPTVPSRFLAELPSDVIETIDSSGDFGDRDAQRLQAEMESQELAEEFYPGQMVRHAIFGIGRILDISAAGQFTRAVVQFKRAGQKTLILQYTRLEPVG